MAADPYYVDPTTVRGLGFASGDYGNPDNARLTISGSAALAAPVAAFPTTPPAQAIRVPDWAWVVGGAIVLAALLRGGR